MDIYDRFVALKNKKGYDKQNALSLAVACQLAYAKPNKVQTVVSAWGFSLIDIINVLGNTPFQQLFAYLLTNPL